MPIIGRDSLNFLALIGVLLACAFLVNGYAQCPAPVEPGYSNTTIVSGSKINTTNASESNTLIYENSTYGFRMEYPTSWIMEEPDPNDMHIVVGFLAPGEDMDNPINYVMVQVEDLPAKPAITLDQYAQAVMLNLKKVYTDYKIISAKNRDISGHPGKELSYNMTSGGSNYRNLLAITIKDNKAYTITLVSLRERYPQFENDANVMINSFEFADVQALSSGIGSMVGIPKRTN